MASGAQCTSIFLLLALLGSSVPLAVSAGAPAAEAAAGITTPSGPPYEPLAEEKPAQREAGSDPPVPALNSQGEPLPLGEEHPAALMDNIQVLHGVQDAWDQGWDGSGVNVAIVDSGIDFAHLDLQGTQAVETDPASPYFGWPLVFDPLSMAKYQEEGFVDETWYANTTIQGPGPFELTHTIMIDGENDFGAIAEKWAADPRDESATGQGGNKKDFDLTNLFITRDPDFWYVGFPTYLLLNNTTYTLFIDVDNETGGATYGPGGALVTTNTSHSDLVNDAAYRPGGTQVATVSSDRFVRIWDVGGARVFDLEGHNAKPYSLAWSPGGNILATMDKDEVILWDPDTGAILSRVAYANGIGIDVPSDTRLSTALAFSPDGSLLAVGATNRLHIYDVSVPTAPVFQGSIWPQNTNVNAVAFNPNPTGPEDEVAVGLGLDAIRAYRLNTSSVQDPVVSIATPLFELLGHTQPVLSVAWSPDGSKIVSGAKDGNVILWDVASRTADVTRPDHASWVYGVDWGPLQASGFVSVSRGLPSATPSIRFWSSAGSPLNSATGTNPFYAVDFASGEAVTASGDLSARRWSTGGSELAVLVAQKPDYALVAVGGSVYSAKDDEWVHGFQNATLYRWDDVGQSWLGDELTGDVVGGEQAFKEMGTDQFIEMAIPRGAIGDPPGIAVTLVTTDLSQSHAQDSTPPDRNVFDVNRDQVEDKGLDFSDNVTALSSFAFRIIPQYTVSGVTSANGTFHFGFHPSPVLQRQLGAVGLLVVDSTTPGLYDTVYVDLNGDNVFDSSDVVLDKGNPVGWLDNFDANVSGPGQDGVPDISSGMIYFIADGSTPIPYSDVYRTRKNIQPEDFHIPGNGDLVAFAGDFYIDPVTRQVGRHGTMMASAVAGQGRAPVNAVTGVAPGAKLITVANYQSDPLEAWHFAVLGYDGAPDTGDEADIVLSPFNFVQFAEDGWDEFSRGADLESFKVSQGTALFVNSAGDFGFGYGTVKSPGGAPFAITVGRATDYTHRSSGAGGPEGASPHFGDVDVTSSRGPTAMGVPKPDVVAVGTAILALPLHSSSSGTLAVTSVPVEGTDVSAAVTAGIAALVREAFAATWGSPPSVTEIREMILSGADDLDYDVLSQGAGMVNASRSTRLASNNATAGVSASPDVWIPGGFFGGQPGGFTRVMFPGDSESLALSLSNHATGSVDVTVSDEVFQKIGGYSFANETFKDSLYSPDGDIVLWFNASGLHQVDASGSPATLTVVTRDAGDPAWWNNADMVKITAHANWSKMLSLDAENWLIEYTYAMSVYDWEPNPANWAGLPWGPFPFPAFFTNELNTYAEALFQSNVLEGRVADPAGRSQSGIVIQLFAPSDEFAIEGLTWTFDVEFYQRTDWTWVTLNGMSGSVPVTVGPGGATVTALVTVPAGAGVGSYEAALRIVTVATGEVTTVPVLVNVAATGPKLSFGGNFPSDDLYDNSRIFGGYDRALLRNNIQRPHLADRRFYYYDIPDQGLFAWSRGMRIYVDAMWLEKPSDMDLRVLGKRLADDAAKSNATRYGPYTLGVAGESEVQDGPAFQTNTNTSEEVITVDLRAGLNVLIVKGIALSGTLGFEAVNGTLGWIQASPEVEAVTNQLAGQETVRFSSNLDFPDGLTASAVGPAITQEFKKLEVKQDFEDWMLALSWGEIMRMGSFTWCIDLEKALILEVHIAGYANAPDLDLGVFRNLDGDCTYNEAEGVYESELTDEEVDVGNAVNLGGNLWFWDADGDADETVKWVAPPDGQYVIRVLAYSTIGGMGNFDMEIGVTLDTGKGYEIAEARATDDLLVSTIGGLGAHTLLFFNMTWDLPGDSKDGEYGGAVLVGTPRAPGILVIPAVVAVDRVAPTITNFVVGPGTGYVLDEASKRWTNSPMPKIGASVNDLDRGELVFETAGVWINGENVTSAAGINIQHQQNPDDKWGYWTGDITYTPPAALKDGTYVVVIRIADRAGNWAEEQFYFVVDKEAPFLALEGKSLEFTTASTTTVVGFADPAATVLVPGAEVSLDANGRFQVAVDLVEGENEIEVQAVDWFGAEPGGNPVSGNVATAKKTVIYDIIPPRFSSVQIRSADPTPLEAVEVTGFVKDDIAPGVAYDPTAVTVTVGSSAATVRPDGSFSIFVELAEGTNNFPLTATDPAGNSETITRVVTRDSSPPVLSVEPIPAEVSSSTLVVRGTVSGQMTLAMNGKLLTTTAGAFETEVTLSRGLNVLVIEAVDAAGNPTEARFAVNYVPPAGNEGLLVYLLPPLLLVLGVLLGYFAGVRYGPRPPEEEEGLPAEEAPEEDERVAKLREAYEAGRISEELYEENLARLGVAVPAEVEEVAEEEVPAEEEIEEPPSEEDERVAKLKAAYEAGRISEELYRENLARLGVAVPEAAEEAVEEELPAEEISPEEEEAEIPEEVEAPTEEVPAEDERVAKVREAFEAGRISEELYRENLARLGVAVPAEEEIEEAPAEEDERVAKLKEAYEAGKISEDLYRENLVRLGVAVPEAAEEAVEEELPAEEISPEEEEAEIHEEVEAPTEEVPAEDERVAKVREAYEAGRISEELYRENLARLGVAVPAVAEEAVEEEEVAPEDVRVAKLREAFEAGRISEELYVENLARLGVAVSKEAVEEVPEEEIEAEAPEEVSEEEAEEAEKEAPKEEAPAEDERVAKLKEAYEAGRISDAVYRENLARLGVSPPGEAPDTAQLTRLAEAFAEDRVSADLFARNLEKMALPEGVEMVDRIEAVVRAYSEGKISEGILRENVRRILEG